MTDPSSQNVGDEDSATSQTERGTQGLRRLGNVVMALAVGVAAAGLFVGFHRGGQTHNTARSGNPSSQSPPDATDIPVARSYGELKDARLGANENWSSRLPATQVDHAELFTTPPGDPTLRGEALTQRADRRAYDGAPPIVPHSIDQVNPTACLACHGEGLKIGRVVAPRMSHQLYTNCTQCHVEASSTLRGELAAITISNRFAGRESPVEGERAWEGAPPTIPHTTWMRQNCNSCHGVLADPGLRTSHPWRTNCVQCHAPSAALDRLSILPADRPPVTRPVEDGTP